MSFLRRFGPALALLAFFLTVLTIGLATHPFEYDTDEGLNLIKAMLLGRGYSLYSQIWSDQPPVFTYLLAWWFKLTGPSVTAGRVLVLGFSCLLLISLYNTVRTIEASRLRAFVAAAMAGLCAWYSYHSFAVMIGLPALGLGVCALWLAAQSRLRGNMFLAALAGILMALSLQTKLFTAVFVPSLIVLLLAPIPNLPQSPMRTRLALLVAMLVCCAAVFLGIWLLAHEPALQIVSTHTTVSDLPDEPRPTKVYTVMRRDWALSLLAVLSIALIRRKNVWQHLLPLLWLVVAAIALQMHNPVWRHHSLLLTIPAAWAGALALVWLWNATRFKWLRCAGIALACYIVVFGIRNIARLTLFDIPPEARQDIRAREELLARVKQCQSHTQWLFSDLPMVAFRAGIPTPPSVAVVSVKRMNAGQLSDADIVDAVGKYHPEQIAIGRVPFSADVIKYFDEHYRLMWQEGKVSHYLRADLPGATTQPGASAK
jgi:4-amino-4-deoxy-L-arabinose transferase-like glycosyltransferase